jgi:hypothetical protein
LKPQGPLPGSGVRHRRGWSWLPADRAQLLALVFLISGLTGTACLAMLLPPYQVPDEINHFLRADQVSRLGLLGVPVPERM